MYWNDSEGEPGQGDDGATVEYSNAKSSTCDDSLLVGWSTFIECCWVECGQKLEYGHGKKEGRLSFSAFRRTASCQATLGIERRFERNEQRVGDCIS